MMMLLRRFHRNEEGVSLTEFIITVPIFLSLMVGILNMGQLLREVPQAGRYAATEMWEATYAAESDTLRMSARYEWTELGSHQGWIGNMYSAYAGATGHWGESFLYSGPLMTGLTGRTIPTHGEYGRMRQNRTLSPSNIVGNAHVATMMVNDGLTFDSLTTSMGGNPTSLTGIIGAVAGSAVAISGASAGFGAGIRYGQVRTTYEHSFEMSFGGSRDWTYGYTSLVSPTTEGPLNPEQRSFLVARASAEIRNPYNSLMDFWRSTLNNETYNVPNY